MKKGKKTLSMLLAVCMLAAALAGCGEAARGQSTSAPVADATEVDSKESASTVQETPAPTEASVETPEPEPVATEPPYPRGEALDVPPLGLTLYYPLEAQYYFTISYKVTDSIEDDRFFNAFLACEWEDERYALLGDVFVVPIDVVPNTDPDSVSKIVSSYIMEKEIEKWGYCTVSFGEPIKVKTTENLAYFYCNKGYLKTDAELAAEGWNEEQIAEYHTLPNQICEILAAADYYEPVAPGAELIGESFAFESVDVEGNSVSLKEVFADKELTMIYVWATWCQESMEGLRDLQALSERLQEENAQLIGLVVESKDYEAASVATRKGLSFLNVMPPEGWEELQAFQFHNIPAAFFVDSSGKILKKPIFIGQIEEYEKMANELLDVK